MQVYHSVSGSLAAGHVTPTPKLSEPVQNILLVYTKAL
jgi:hypothetical protein